MSIGASYSLWVTNADCNKCRKILSFHWKVLGEIFLLVSYYPRPNIVKGKRECIRIPPNEPVQSLQRAKRVHFKLEPNPAVGMQLVDFRARQSSPTQFELPLFRPKEERSSGSNTLNVPTCTVLRKHFGNPNWSCKLRRYEWLEWTVWMNERGAMNSHWGRYSNVHMNFPSP